MSETLRSAGHGCDRLSAFSIGWKCLLRHYQHFDMGLSRMRHSTLEVHVSSWKYNCSTLEEAEEREARRARR
jgi:hypothetical protein